jgi:hypothetical protein
MFRVIMTPADAYDVDIFYTGTVGQSNMQAVIDQWTCGGPCAVDVNHDDVVDIADLQLVLMAWGPCPG